MAQNWTDNVFQGDHVGQTDLQNMENNFACLKSLFSGASQPASMAACHPWFDTTKHVLKVRNDGDTAWYGLMHGDISQKLWIYRNAAMSGWAVDSGVSDKVLAIKGGSTYTTGGATAGTWTQPSHAHGVGTYAGPNHSHSLNTGGAIQHYPNTPIAVYGGALYTGSDGSGAVRALSTTDAKAGAVTGTSAGGATVATYRPAAAVGTLQYLDI